MIGFVRCATFENLTDHKDALLPQYIRKNYQLSRMNQQDFLYVFFDTFKGMLGLYLGAIIF